MILGVLIGEDWRFVDPQEDVARTVEEVLEFLTARRGVDDPGQVAELTFARLPWQGHAVDTDNHLFVSANEETGFGALTWFVDQGWPRKGEIYNDVWVTDNPKPPSFDPRVVSDPDCGTFYHSRSDIPLSQVRAALVEFCSMRSGDRPECVSWVPGRIDGRRLDENFPRKKESESAWALPENPWEGS